MDLFGRNLDAILGIIAYSNEITALGKGLSPADSFFAFYDESTYQGSMRQLGKFIVHVLDDHDMSARPRSSALPPTAVRPTCICRRLTWWAPS